MAPMDMMKGAVYAAMVLSGKEVEEGEEAVTVRRTQQSSARRIQPRARDGSGASSGGGAQQPGLRSRSRRQRKSWVVRKKLE